LKRHSLEGVAVSEIRSMLLDWVIVLGFFGLQATVALGSLNGIALSSLGTP
jgi:hypothetical protein